MAMRAHSTSGLPAEQGLLRQRKRRESGEVPPKEFCQPVIAATFGTVTRAIFLGAPPRDPYSDVLALDRHGHPRTRHPAPALRP
jgi:hypothetical protein